MRNTQGFPPDPGNAGEIQGWIPKRNEARKSVLPDLVIYL